MRKEANKKNDMGVQCEGNKRLQALLLYHSLSKLEIFEVCVPQGSSAWDTKMTRLLEGVENGCHRDSASTRLSRPLQFQYCPAGLVKMKRDDYRLNNCLVVILGYTLI